MQSWVRCTISSQRCTSANSQSISISGTTTGKQVPHELPLQMVSCSSLDPLCIKGPRLHLLHGLLRLLFHFNYPLIHLTTLPLSSCLRPLVCSSACRCPFPAARCPRLRFMPLSSCPLPSFAVYATFKPLVVLPRRYLSSCPRFTSDDSFTIF